MTAPIILADETIEAIARCVVALLREDAPVPGTLVDATTLASALGISRATVYEHAEKLGAVRIGDGKRPRLRFDVARARAVWAAADSKPRSEPNPGTVATRRRRVRRKAPNAGLLPVGSKSEAA